MNANRWALCILAVTSLLLAAPQRFAAPEARYPDWAPKRVSQRFARTAQMVNRFVARMSESNGRDLQAEEELLAQGRERAQASLRGLLRELPSSDRFRFVVAFTMYWMGFDPQSSRAVMLEYCPPDSMPGSAEALFDVDTIAFLGYAYRKRPDRRLLEGVLAWVPQADGCLVGALARILPRIARSEPRDLLAALKDQPLQPWGRTAGLLVEKGQSPERAYPGLVAIASRGSDPLSQSAKRLLKEMASAWPAEDQWPPADPAALHGDLVLVPGPKAANGEWYGPAWPFVEWLGAQSETSPDKSSITITWRGESYTWTRQSGLLVMWDWVPYIPIQDLGEQLGERVSLRADGRVIDFGTPGEGRLYAAIPVGWQTPAPPKGLSEDEMEIWSRLLRPNTRPGTVICEPYDIRIVGRWAAAKVHPLNLLADDALVLLDGYWGAWRIIAIGADLPARGRNYGIPVEARQKLGLPF